MFELLNKIEKIDGVNYGEYQIIYEKRNLYIWLNKYADVDKCINDVKNKIKTEYYTYKEIFIQDMYDITIIILKDLKINREELIEHIVKLSTDEMDLELALYLAKLESEGLKNYYYSMNI